MSDSQQTIADLIEAAISAADVAHLHRIIAAAEAEGGGSFRPPSPAGGKQKPDRGLAHVE